MNRTPLNTMRLARKASTGPIASINTGVAPTNILVTQRQCWQQFVELVSLLQ